MKILLKTSGGFANLRLEGQIDTADLEPDVARWVEETLVPEKLEAAAPAAAVGEGPAADLQLAELTLLPDDEDGEARTFLIDDSCADEEIVAVLDELRYLLVRRKQEALKAGREEEDSAEGEESVEESAGEDASRGGASPSTSD